VHVVVELPAALAEVAGSRVVPLELPQGATVADLVPALADRHPGVGRRVCDETGALRRFVNVYVDDEDVRQTSGLATPLSDGSVVLVLPSIAGGSASAPSAHRCSG
jgi:molybdopterin converting factor small subunit